MLRLQPPRYACYLDSSRTLLSGSLRPRRSNAASPPSGQGAHCWYSLRSRHYGQQGAHGHDTQGTVGCELFEA